MFRNVTLLRVHPEVQRITPCDLDAAVKAKPLRSPGPLELATCGFVSPYGRDLAEILMLERHTLLTFGTESRVLPAQVVNDAVAEKCKGILAERGRKPGGRERRRIRDEVMAELMPRAFIKPTRVNAWFDHTTGWLAIDSTSKRQCDDLVSALRDAMGGFPATPVSAQTSARLILSAWLTGDALPGDFALGGECELRDPVDDGAVVRCRRQDLSADEVREHTNAGKLVERLAVTYDERLGVVIGQDLTLRKLRFTDVALDRMGEVEHEDADAELLARFALLTAEFTRLRERLVDEFELETMV